MQLPYGNYSIVVEEHIITVSLTDSFNQAGAEALTNDIKRTISRFKGKPFSIMVIDTTVSGNTPDAYEKINKYNKWLNEQNLIAKALVVPSGAIRKINDVRIPAKAKQNVRSFDNVPDALVWLKNQS
tara:strand:+ start:1924 stop:2304 length:381 start_codon:yes stop_codon:yes gene_type:complete